MITIDDLEYETKDGFRIAELTLRDQEAFWYNERVVAVTGDKVRVIKWADGGIDIHIS